MALLLFILLLFLAMPVGIVVFAVAATQAEQNADPNAPVSRLTSALVFGLTAELAVFLFFGSVGVEFSPAMALIPGLPAALIAAFLAFVGRRFLVLRSKVLSALSGVAITILTVIGVTAAIASLLTSTPSQTLVFASVGAVAVLFPSGVSALALGAFSGVLLSYISNRQHSSLPLSEKATESTEQRAG